jgi:hypothetical protein
MSGDPRSRSLAEQEKMFRDNIHGQSTRIGARTNHANHMMLNGTETNEFVPWNSERPLSARNQSGLKYDVHPNYRDAYIHERQGMQNSNKV